MLLNAQKPKRKQALVMSYLPAIGFHTIQKKLIKRRSRTILSRFFQQRFFLPTCVCTTN